MRKLRKRLAAFGLAGMLALSCPFVSLAAGMTPGSYVFAMALRACGVSPGGKVDVWQDAFEGYLEKSGNQALLNQVRGYGGLSWGDTTDGTDSLYWGVREWVSSASIQEAGDGSLLYTLPSSPSPQPDKLSVLGEKCVRSVPFSGINDLPSADSGNYSYLFSDIYINRRNSDKKPFYCRRNVYAPKGVEVFGIVSYIDYDWISVKYFTPDSSVPAGYRQVSLKSMEAIYLVEDDSLQYKNTSPNAWNYNNMDARTVMNHPFKIFATAEDAGNYCRTGTVSNLFTADSVPLLSGGESQGADSGLVNHGVLSVGGQMPLPGDATAAGVSLGAVSVPLGMEELSAYLGAGGFQIEYNSAHEAEPVDSVVVGAVSSITDTVFRMLLDILPWAFLIFGVILLVFLFVKIYKRMTADS